MFSCPLYRFNLNTIHCWLSQSLQTKASSRCCFSPPSCLVLFFPETVPESDMFLNTAGLGAPPLCSFFLFPLHVFGVRSLCQAGIVGTVAGVTLARRTRRPRLACRAGVSWLSLGSSLSRASVFTITMNTSWT